tara:strand:- start:117 stop:317 length:201 start_codon:yes stop_codon:yes gene_type:complete
MKTALRKRKLFSKFNTKKTQELDLELILLYIRVKGLKIVTQKFKDFVKQMYRLILENNNLDAQITR